eukprot:COSAG06_NODE_33141_length_494_cov_1.918987_2_plen_71_part_01
MSLVCTKTIDFTKTGSGHTWKKLSKKAFLQGWEEKTSRSSGDKYWVHLATGESTWERPVDSSSKRDNNGTE